MSDPDVSTRTDRTSSNTPGRGPGLRWASNLVRTEWPKLVRDAMKELKGDREGAEDLVSSVIFKFAAGQFDHRPLSPDQVLSFARGVLRNEAKHVRRGRRTVYNTAHFVAQESIDSDAVVTSGLREEVEAAFTHLTAAERSVVELHYLRGYTVTETARLRNVSEKTTKELLRRARRKLRDEFSRSDDDERPGPPNSGP